MTVHNTTTNVHDTASTLPYPSWFIYSHENNDEYKMLISNRYMKTPTTP